MTVRTVRAAIADAVTQVACAGPVVSTEKAIAVVQAATGDSKNFKSERALIADFFESRRQRPSPGSSMTRHCNETTTPAFEIGAERVMQQYLALPTGAVATEHVKLGQTEFQARVSQDGLKVTVTVGSYKAPENDFEVKALHVVDSTGARVNTIADPRIYAQRSQQPERRLLFQLEASSLKPGEQYYFVADVSIGKGAQVKTASVRTSGDFVVAPLTAP